MKIEKRSPNALFVERFKRNWRLKPGPRTWSFRPVRSVAKNLARNLSGVRLSN